MGTVPERLPAGALVIEWLSMKLAILSSSLLIVSYAFAAMPLEPGATLFENDQVKVMRALEKAHVKGKAHEHKSNRVMIYLQAGVQRFEYQDGRQPEVFNWKADQVNWSPSNGTHAPEVTGDDNFNILEVELKTPGTGKAIPAEMDPLKIDPKHYKLEFENDQVRVSRVKIGAHEATPLHRHTTNRVSVYLTDQSFRTTSEDGKVEAVKHKAGEAVWGTPLTHKEENVSDQPFEVILVELK